MSGSCKNCGRCCRVMVIGSSSVENDLSWMDGRNGVKKGPYMFLPLPCKHLTPENKCSLHEVGKPAWCKGYPENLGWQPWMALLGCRYFD